MKNHPALTICAIFFTYMTCMLPYCASETPCPGIECVENCMLHESKYVCQMKTKNRKSLTLYCPAENSQEYSQEYSQDHEWTSLYCKIDNKYYLCHKSLQYNQALEHYWISIETNKRECIQVNFKALQDHKHIADGHSFRKEITELIAMWNNGYLRSKAKSGLIKSENLRIDLQGVVSRGTQHYYNLQIQINRPRKKGESTTVSQVFTPEIPASYIRTAFTESFLNRAKVTGEVKRVEQCKNKK